MQKDQLLEKRMIFHKYLPDSLVKDVLNELTQEEDRELSELRAKLEADKKAKMAEMLAAQRKMEEELRAQMESLKKLEEIDLDELKKEEALKKM